MTQPLYHLSYAISKRTPPSARTLKAIFDAQSRLNERLTWSHNRLSLASVIAEPLRAPFAFPYVRFAPRFQSPSFPSNSDATSSNRIPDATAFGTTKADLWSAHLVAAFLQQMSERNPELLFELRDEGGFVVPGAVWIRAGKVELQRDWLNRERERVLEATGDPEAALPFLWAESESLAGRFFLDAPVSEFAEVPEIAELDLNWDDVESMSISDVAKHVVRRALASVAAAA